MDKIEKLLRAMNPVQKQATHLLLEQLQRNYKLVPGIKKLVGKKGYFRVRMGNYRIIFVVQRDGSVDIRRVTKRDEDTYKNL